MVEPRDFLKSKLKEIELIEHQSNLIEQKTVIELNRTNQEIFVKFDSCSIGFGNRTAIVRFCSIKFDGSITKIGSIGFS